MLLRWIIAAALALATTIAAPAQDRLAAVGWGMTNVGGTVSAAAPTCGGWNVAGYADGCAGSPPAGPYTVQYPNFLTATSTLDSGVARQSGQPAYGNVGTNTGCVNPNCHPPWAIAGVDYPVGPSCGNTCGFASPGSATDPTNSSSPNWGAGNPGNCHNSAGVGNPPYITCTGTMTTGTFNVGPFDFSYQGNSVGVAPAFNVGGGIQVPCIIHDSNFAFDLQLTPTPTATVAYQITGCTSITLLNDKFYVLDAYTHQPTQWNFRQSGTLTGVTISGTTLTATGSSGTPATGNIVVGPGLAPGTSLSSGSGLSWVVNTSQTVSSPVSTTTWNGFGLSYFVNIGTSPFNTVNRPTTVKYSAFLNCPTRCIWFGGDLDFEFNYWSGLNTYDNSVALPAHGDGWFAAFNNNAMGGSGLNYEKAFNNTWLLIPNMNIGLGSFNGQNAATCLMCGNIQSQTGSPTMNVQNGSTSLVVDSNGFGTIPGGGIMSPSIGNSSYNYGGFPVTFPGNGWAPSMATCPATGCGIAAQVTFSGSVSGTALTTDASTTLQTNEFVATTGTLFTGATLTGTSLTATGAGAATPMVGDTITGTSVPAGTWLVSGSGLSWTLNQSVTGTIGPETISSQGPSPASPLITAGGTGTSFTLSTSVGTIPDQSWTGQTGLGTWTLSKPWVSNLSGSIAGGVYPIGTVNTLDFERNTLIGNFINSNSPSYLGAPQIEVSSPIFMPPWSVSATYQNNYFDVCGTLGTSPAYCSSPTASATGIRSYLPGSVSTTYADGSNIEMNNGACLFVQGTQPSSCAPIPP